MFLKKKATPTLFIILSFCLIEFIFRLAFAVYFSSSAQEYNLQNWFKAFYIGFKFDLRISLILALPFALINPILPVEKYSFLKKIWAFFYSHILVFFIYGYYMDFAYYSYLQTRINGSALKFLANPWISLEMAWQTYPMIRMILFSLLPGILFYHILLKWGFSKRLLPRPPYFFHQISISPWLKKVSLSLLAILFYILGLYGKFSQYPLRWSEAFFTNHFYISALALNPWHYFLDTYKVSQLSFNKENVKKHYALMSDFLGVKDKDLNTLNFTRPLSLTPQIQKKPNIIIIVMESFSAHKTGSFGHPLDPTPFFDSIAREGTLFTEFYTPSEGTARSIFTLVSSVPDLTQYRTSSRNPLIVDQNTVINAFSDYEKYYFLGGSANWGEIRGVLQRNIKNLKVFEEGSYSSPKTDVWGISDYHLFEEAHKAFKNRNNKDQPFFALIQTSGFHRPYTIPDGFDEVFKEKKLTSKEVKETGFVNNEEYNALRFADFSLKRFFDLYKSSPEFDNTIFVITGDHGLPELKAKHVSKGFQHFGLERFHVPLLFYGPHFFKSEKKDVLISEPDLVPTLAGLTGRSFQLSGMGRNVLSNNFENQRGIFTYVYHTTPQQYYYFNKNYLVQGDTLNGVTGLFEYKGLSPDVNVKDRLPDIYQNLKNYAEAYYETSLYLLYHNKAHLKSSKK